MMWHVACGMPDLLAIAPSRQKGSSSSFGKMAFHGNRNRERG